jgi:methyltransferase
MTFVLTTVQRIEGSIRSYVKALDDAEYDAIAACFCPDAVHYFPAAPKLSGAETIAGHFADSVRKRGISWTVDQMLVDVDRCAAALEWSRFSPRRGRHMRGVDWFIIDPETFRFREVRTYLAAMSDPHSTNLELQDFDYVGRGYPMRAPRR